jgi:hypothetical protein
VVLAAQLGCLYHPIVVVVVPLQPPLWLPMCVFEHLGPLIIIKKFLDEICAIMVYLFLLWMALKFRSRRRAVSR